MRDLLESEHRNNNTPLKVLLLSDIQQKSKLSDREFARVLTELVDDHVFDYTLITFPKFMGDYKYFRVHGLLYTHITLDYLV